MTGILIIAKPSGPTSFAIVAQVKRITGEKRVGHGGTLDPLASGVLPVFLGQATRVVEYLQEYPKTYRAGIMLGIATDTYDAEGQVTASKGASGITRQDIEAALPSFLGPIMQAPPAFSALKREGQPIYKLARQGLAPEMVARPVTVYRLEIVDFQPPLLTLDVECGKGTYIRSLAHNLGQKLGVGAHLKSLVRTAYGPFDIKDAVTLEQLQEAAGASAVESLLKPLDAVLTLFPAVTLTAEQEQDVRNGKQLALSPLSPPGVAPSSFSSPLTGEDCLSRGEGVSRGRDPSKTEVRGSIDPCYSESPSYHSEPSEESRGEEIIPIPLTRLRVYSPAGRLVALLTLDAETSAWQPDKVFN